MREFVKVVAILVFCVSATAAAIVWSDDRPSQDTWIWRISLPLIAVAAIVVFLVLHKRRDLAPDFLSQRCQGFFDRNGFCFAITATSENGVCRLQALFQNRYERACCARIALRPAAGVFRSAVKPFRAGEFPAMTFEIPCGPGAFGIASLPLPVRKQDAGKRLTLQVGATVNYPDGKGKMLRFRDGATIRHDADFRNPFHRTLQVLYLLGGGILFSFPGSITFELPAGVAEVIPPGHGQLTETLWTLGDNLGETAPETARPGPTI